MSVKQLSVKKCNACGKTLPEDSIFCQYCGSKDVSDYQKMVIVQKVCGCCGKNLPDDSEFCQYCGSSDVRDKEVPGKIVKKCETCGKELPDDSEFCSYCGSSKLVETVDEVMSGRNQKEEHTKIDESHNTNKKGNQKVYIIALVCLLGLFIVFLSSKTPSVYKEIQFDNGVIESKGLSINHPTSESMTVTIKAPANRHVMVFVGSKSYAEHHYSLLLLKKGSSYKFYIPKGQYVMYFAMGDKWFGSETKFGSNTEYYVYHGTINTVLRKTLNIDLNGYAVIDRINENDFPLKQ